MTFTAADLEAALEERDDLDWYEIATTEELNPDYDPELGAKYERLQDAWRRRSYNDPGKEAAREAYYGFYSTHGSEKLYQTRSCPNTVTLHGVTYPISVVTQVGGEGQGDVLYTVIEVGGRLFRKDGYYASYDRGSWDGDFREVEATTKTITVYEALSDDNGIYTSY